ncbi:MAG: hypothetical protein M1831_001841 [Alyxoria varia]|nr:MAG: hypothetical protein M1831_001841 [Alyxoria varia]
MHNYKASLAEAANQASSVFRADFLPIHSTAEEEAQDDIMSPDTLPIPEDQFYATEHLREYYEQSDAHSTMESPRVSAADSVFSKSDGRTSMTATSADPDSPQKPAKRSNTYSFSASEVDLLALDLVESQSVQQAVREQALNLPQVDPDPNYENSTELLLPALYKSMCICDTNVSGSPVRYRSKYFSIGPRGLKVGRCQFLIVPDQVGNEVYLTARPGGDSRPHFVLEYVGSLINGSTGDPLGYIMAAQMDVTYNIRCLATNMLRRKRENQVDRYSTVSVDAHPPALDNKQASLGVPSSPPPPYAPELHRPMSMMSIDWLAVATEESFAEDDQQFVLTPNASTSTPEIGPTITHGIPNNKANDPTIQKDTPTLSDADFSNLHEHVSLIRFFHRDFFVLAPNPETKFWQIASNSPSLSETSADIADAVSHTGQDTLQRLGELLSGSEQISMMIRWGVEGSLKRLYCVPMCGGGAGAGAEGDEEGETDASGRCWLCFLVDGSVPNAWELLNEL